MAVCPSSLFVSCSCSSDGDNVSKGCMGHEGASSQVVHHCLGSILAFIHGFAARRCSRDGIGACGKDVASVGSGGGDEDGTGVGDATGDVQSVGGIGESAVGCSFSDGSSYSLSGSVTTEIGVWYSDTVSGDEGFTRGCSHLCFSSGK